MNRERTTAATSAGGAARGGEALLHPDIEGREAFLQAIFAHSLSAIVVADDHGDYLAVNAAAARLLGRSPEALVGFNVADLELVGSVPAKPRYERFLEGTREEGEITFRRPDGEVRTATYRAVRVRPGFNLSILDDVTERRRLEEDQRRVQTLEALGVLAGGIAHDFNNLLTAVTNDLSVVAGDARVPADALELVREAQVAAGRAAGLSRQLLTFARGGAPVRESADLAEIVRETAAHALRGANTRAEIHVVPDVWPVHVDPGQVAQVVQNLVLNAAQAMPGGGVAHIHVANVDAASSARYALAPGRYVRFSVRDAGDGIDAGVLPRIFDPYFSTRVDGQGLGLAVCHSIVRRHQGAMTVDSTPGEGATFTVVLPAADAAPSRPPSPERPRVDGRGLRALVVDDEPLVRRTLVRVLARAGLEAVACAEGAEAVTRYRASLEAGARFDLVITDLTIPGGLGGEEAARQLRALDPHVVVCVMTGYAESRAVSSPRDHGFAAALRKPFAVDDVHRLLHRLGLPEARGD